MPVATRKPTKIEREHIRYVRPAFYPKQERAIFSPDRYGLIEASTKAGKTVGCLGWQWEQVIGSEIGTNHWWVAPVFGQARIAYERAKRYFPPELYKSHESLLRLNVCGRFWWFKSGERPDDLYGEDVFSAVLDESSRIKEASFHAVRSTLTATRGPLRAIGNVTNRRNWFYRLSRLAETGQFQAHYAKLTAWDAVEAGVLEEDEILDAKAMLPDHVFRALYLAEPAEDDLNPFGIENIHACAVLPSFSSENAVCWGWDLAKKRDYTVGVGLDWNGRVTNFVRWKGVDWPDQIERIRGTTGHVRALVDSTGLGDPIMDQLRKQSPNFTGSVLTSKSKQQHIERLATAVQAQKVLWPATGACETLTSEMEEFTYEATRTGVRYTAPEGFHDDCVIALAFAYSMLDRLKKGQEVESQPIPSTSYPSIY